MEWLMHFRGKNLPAGRRSWQLAGQILFAIALLGCTSCQKPTAPTKPPSGGQAADGADAQSPGKVKAPAGENAMALVERLYAQNCAACHGATGDGNGVAALFLFPKPRDFRAGKFRLISTNNNVPTIDDIEAVLVRGMPGSSMPPWAHLSQADRRALAQEVVRKRREGARDQIVKILKEDEEDAQIDEAQVSDFVTQRTTPGDVLPVANADPPNGDVVARGQQIYLKQGCASCHGNEGKGDGQQKMVDDEGFPTRPRDLTRGVFKGDYDVASLYRRIALGMPGTPMPASISTLPPDQILDLVHFIRSLSDEETRESVSLKRERLTVARVRKIPTSPQDESWQAIKPVRLRMAPLWWRDDSNPGLEVRAAHDGQSLALQLSWNDVQADMHALKSESFRDGVAIELYRGESEPFIGMGAPGSPVDVWMWDADRQFAAADVEDENPRIVVDLYPPGEETATTAEFQRPGTKTDAQRNESLTARASGNQIRPGEGQTGSSALAAGGPGSVTFRVPKNQLVQARGQWANGRWTVLMSRPLQVNGEGNGVSLQPGERASIAFAVWDGSHRDRGGQKLVTIWQDLLLEGSVR